MNGSAKKEKVCAPADADDRFNNDRKTGGFKTDKQRLYASDVTVLGIDQTEGGEDKYTR